MCVDIYIYISRPGSLRSNACKDLHFDLSPLCLMFEPSPATVFVILSLFSIHFQTLNAIVSIS